LSSAERGRVGHHDVGALQARLRGDVEGRRVADVVAARLERRTQHGDPAADERPAASLAGQLHDLGSPPQVDGVDLAQEGQRLVGTQLTGPCHERADVLGQAAPAESEACVEELAADAVVIADGVGERLDVRPAASATSAMALMKEIFVARKEFAATLTSSAVARSVTTTGQPAAIGRA
jgi:hypothetical protein